MKILMINVVCGIRSTGRICTDLARKLEEEGHEVKIAYGRGKVPPEYQKYAIKIGNTLDQNIHALQTRLLDQHGFGSRKVTRKFLAWAEQYGPLLTLYYGRVWTMEGILCDMHSEEEISGQYMER